MTLPHSALAIAQALGQPPPTPEQRAVIEAPLRPVLVVAGAGSGKTETMAGRVVWLIANGLVAPQEVLGLTFTRKAALELSERVAGKLAALRSAGLLERPEEADPYQEAFDLPTISTYHAYAGRLVSEHGLRLGIEPDARLLTEAASWQLASEVVERYEGDVAPLTKAPSTIVQAVLRLSGELAEHLRGTDEAAEWLRRTRDRVAEIPGRDGKRPLACVRDTVADLDAQLAVYPIVQDYAAEKRRRGVLDFSDQMALAARLAREVPAVGAAERSRFRAVLLDEFQDTSEAQMVLLAELFAGQELPVTAVGDPHQSIYAWRGASATTLSRFPREFELPDGPAEVLPLSISWRNDRAVLAAANAVAAPLQAVTAVPVQELAARPGAGEGSIEVARVLDQVTEARTVAAWIDEHRTPPGTTTAAVLCRTRSQFPVMVEALRDRGLPVEVVGLGGLLDTPEVLDLVALLWAAQEPTRGDQLMRLLSGPVCRLGAADIDALWAWAVHLTRDTGSGGPTVTQAAPVARDTPAGGPAQPVVDLGREHAAVLAEAVAYPPPTTWIGPGGQQLSETAASRVAWLARVITRVRGLVGLSLPDLLSQAERLLGLDLEIAADPGVHESWGHAQLDALLDVAAGYAASAERVTLGGFLDWLDAAREHERGLEGAEVPELAAVSVDERAVQVLTVHAAKGLEWDCVAVTGLVESVFPNGKVTARTGPEGWFAKDPTDKGWLGGLGKLPTPLRGDREGRPEVPWASLADSHELKDALAQHEIEGGRFAVREERRLAYVALTRARSAMLLTAAVWMAGKTPRVTSRFLDEVRAAAGVEVGELAWVAMPDPEVPEEMQNPMLAVDSSRSWPLEPDARRTAVQELATTLAEARRARPARQPEAGALVEDGTAVVPGPWDEEIEQLLAERRERRRLAPTAPLPEHLSTSAVVSLADDPEAFRRRLRRPLPTPPAPHARLGSAFHAWVEQQYAAAPLVDLDELVDDGSEHDPAEDLDVLQRNFLASEWAALSPVQIEVPLETELAGRSVRGRIDAVFEDADGRRTIVDWKTGSPGSPERQRTRALQLAVYRVAYSRLTGIPVKDLGAAFFYAATGRTVRPELPDEAELEALLTSLVTDDPGGPDASGAQRRGPGSPSSSLGIP